MRWTSAILALATWVVLQPLDASEITGRLRLVDTIPSTTPIENLDVAVRALDRSTVLRAQLDANGGFILTDVVPGRYAFEFSFPGRFVSVVLGGKSISLPVFELTSEDHGPLEITVSMKDLPLSVDLHGLPGKAKEVVAILSPADSQLTLQYSSYVNSVTGPHTEFPFVPAGTYRLFVVDKALASDVSRYAMQFPDFLKEQAPLLEVAREDGTKITTDYIDPITIENAMKHAGPLEP